MKISPRFKLIESGNNVKIIHSYSKDNKYFICERNLEKGTNKFDFNDEPPSSNDYDYLIKYFENIKEQEPNTSYSLFNEDSIFSISYEESDDKDFISKITIHNLKEQNFSKGGYAIYKGKIYKLIVFNSKAAFLYYQTINHEIIYGIKVFESVDDLLSKKVFKDIKSSHLGKINDILFTSDCKYLFSCGNDGIVKRWNLEAKDSPEKSFFLVNSPITSVRLNPFDESLFVAASTNGYLIFYSIGKNKKIKIIPISDEPQNLDKNSNSDLPFTGPAIWADFSPNDPFLTVASGLSDLKTYYISDLFD